MQRSIPSYLDAQLQVSACPSWFAVDAWRQRHGLPMAKHAIHGPIPPPHQQDPYAASSCGQDRAGCMDALATRMLDCAPRAVHLRLVAP